MKHCPNCDTQFDEMFMFCGKCGMKLESSGIDLRKMKKTSGTKTAVPTGDPRLESARASFQAGQFSDCIRQLEDAMESGDAAARRMYGCFLDDSEDFRRAAERHRYSDVFPSSSQFGTVGSSSAGSARTAQTTSQPGGISSPVSDPEAIFQEGTAAFDRGQFDSAFQLFRDAVEEDHAKAKFFLGMCYADGKGVQQDQAKADKWYRQAVRQFLESAQDDADALCCLAMCYEDGKGVEKDDEEAVKWYLKAVKLYRRAAEQGDAEAQYSLGSCYEDGKGVDQDHAKAIQWYRKAAEGGHAAAQNALGSCSQYGDEAFKAVETAVKRDSKATEQDLSEAQNDLEPCSDNAMSVTDDGSAFHACFQSISVSQSYEDNIGPQVSTSTNNAFQESKRESPVNTRVAEHHNKEADFLDTVIFAENMKAEKVGLQTGIIMVYLTAGIISFLILSVFENNSIRLISIAIVLCIIFMFRRKMTKSLRIWESANRKGYDDVKLFRVANDMAEKNNEFAQNHIGLCYALGKGVAKDSREAVKWFKKAEQNASYNAQCNLGRCLYLGEGILQDYTKAVSFFKHADSPPEAHYNLGVCYYLGKGIKKSYTDAVRLFQVSAEKGIKEAQYNLGVCFYNGKGVLKDLAEAKKWWREAADQGQENAIEALKKYGL